MTMSSETIPFENYYTEEVYMVADVEAGVLYNRSGRRMLALTNDFLVGLHHALSAECGDRASEVLQNCGRKWGRNFAEGLDGEWSQFYGAPAKEFPMAMFHSLMVQEFGHNGWGLLTIDYQHIASGVISLALQGAMMAEILPDEPALPADVLTAGIFSGIFSHFMGRDLDCMQSQCAKRGFPESRFLVSSPDRIASVKVAGYEAIGHDELFAKLLQTTG
jgi:uncharacterized protein